LLSIPWHRGAALTPRQQTLIAPSLREFQHGEGLEGGFFDRVVSAHAERIADPECLEAHRRFIAEERRHARDLARYLSLAGIPLLTKPSWLLRAFQWCGSRGGLELILMVVALAEIVNETYYATLRSATRCPVLRRLCSQILRDEKGHVRFQFERLARLRQDRRGWRLTLTHGLEVLLYVGAAFACWLGHRRVIRAGGLGFFAFWRTAFARLWAVWEQKDPRRYRRPSPSLRLIACAMTGGRVHG
jgi:hypothetical protein